MNEQERAESSIDSAIAMSLFRRQEIDRNRSQKILIHSSASVSNLKHSSLNDDDAESEFNLKQPESVRGADL
jgi:hypothetical protein